MCMRPRIGITLDSEVAGGYAQLPWYALRQNYSDAILTAGGLPLLLPHHLAVVDVYLDAVDGVVVTGGAFDVDPALFGVAIRHATVTVKSARTAFEFALISGALERDMPILGICGGQQLLNVVLGGSLIQHIPDDVPGALAHEQPNPRTEPGHTVAALAGSLLARAAGMTAFSVNSAHHQAVKTVGPGVVVSGTAPDGVVEAIELPSKRFCLGVQWHPEYHIDAADAAILRAFVAAAEAL
ncbi:MAG: gamma-glutamyl-gamma-aminobutyrate hydrolase family protein [Rhodospirillaceae bacterium]|nr:gamma-glutamyl-gamma-aminobutyrate hydrolase family protein [Rhodospirillaceae bacterium]